MTKTTLSFTFLGNTYFAAVEFFEPPTVMPYYKVELEDEGLTREFGKIHNFKEVIKNGFVVLEPALDPQGKFHAYFWTCLMSAVYLFLLKDQTESQPG